MGVKFIMYIVAVAVLSLINTLAIGMVS